MEKKRNRYDAEGEHQVIAIIERSAGNAEVGNMWLETRSFHKHTPVSDILRWAQGKCDGRLILTVDSD